MTESKASKQTKWHTVQLVIRCHLSSSKVSSCIINKSIHWLRLCTQATAAPRDSSPLPGKLEVSKQFCLQVMWQEAWGCSLQQHSLGSLPDGGRSPLQLFLCLLHCDHNPDTEKDKTQRGGVSTGDCYGSSGRAPVLLPPAAAFLPCSSRSSRYLQPNIISVAMGRNYASWILICNYSEGLYYVSQPQWESPLNNLPL